VPLVPPQFNVEKYWSFSKNASLVAENDHCSRGTSIGFSRWRKKSANLESVYRHLGSTIFKNNSAEQFISESYQIGGASGKIIRQQRFLFWIRPIKAGP
jgi:hypothetical protein